MCCYAMAAVLTAVPACYFALSAGAIFAVTMPSADMHMRLEKYQVHRVTGAFTVQGSEDDVKSAAAGETASDNPAAASPPAARGRVAFAALTPSQQARDLPPSHSADAATLRYSRQRS